MKLSCLGFVHFPFFCSFDSMMVKCDADAFHFLFFLSFEKQKTSWAVNPMDHHIASYPLWAFLQSNFAYHNVTVWKKKKSSHNLFIADKCSGYRSFSPSFFCWVAGKMVFNLKLPLKLPNNTDYEMFTFWFYVCCCVGIGTIAFWW